MAVRLTYMDVKALNIGRDPNHWEGHDDGKLQKSASSDSGGRSEPLYAGHPQIPPAGARRRIHAGQKLGRKAGH